MKTILTLLILSVAPASAAVVNFTITLGDIVPAGQGLTPGQTIDASVGYDESLVALVGEQTLTPLEDSTITIAITFAGFFYDQTDDTDYPSFPVLRFEDGEIRGISYLAENKSSSAGSISIEGTNQLFTYSFNGESEYFGSVTWPADSAAIPEPSTSLLAILTFTAFFFKRRKRHQ